MVTSCGDSTAAAEWDTLPQLWATCSLLAPAMGSSMPLTDGPGRFAGRPTFDRKVIRVCTPSMEIPSLLRGWLKVTIKYQS